MGRKVCAHQYTGKELQILEVESVVPGTPGHVPGELHPCHNAALRPHGAVHKASLYLVNDQEGI